MAAGLAATRSRTAFRTWTAARQALARSRSARLFYARERLRGHLDPKFGLHCTHRYVAADSGFDVGDAFPDRDRPITIAVSVQRDDGTAQGIIFEAGDATTGLAIWIAGNHEDVVAAAGDVGAGGVTSTATNALPANGSVAHIVVALIPGSSEHRIWINGELFDRDAGTTVPLPNGWAADSAAGIGEVSGTVTARVPAGDQISLTGATIISPVTMYAGQRPRHFNAGILGAIPAAGDLITEAGDALVSEAGDRLVTE